MPDIIAHRGASRECLENTMAAFALALKQGADGVELDVHATGDGVVVVHHDPAVKGTSGDGLPLELEIARTSWAALSDLRLANGEPLPTLDQVMGLAGATATVFVEIKGSGIERPLADCLMRHADARVAVHAFDHRMPRDVRRLIPGIRTGVLSASYLLDLGCMLEPSQADDLWQHAQLIDELLVDQAHAMGVRVIAWTENRADRAAHLVALGVDAICTDTPAALRKDLTALLHR